MPSSKVSQHVNRAPANAPAVKVAGAQRVTSNLGVPRVSVGGVSNPTTRKSGGKGR